MSDQIIHLNQDLTHTELKDYVKNSVEETFKSLLDAEADRLVNAERYARVPGTKNVPDTVQGITTAP